MTLREAWLPLVILLAVVALTFCGMWRGWRRRGAKHDVPPLLPVPHGDPDPRALAADARFYGTTVAGEWLDRVVARGLGTRSRCLLRLSPAGLDVVRAGDPFRVPAAALRGARHDQGHAGKVVPPYGLLVVTWQHGDLLLESGFRLVGLDADQPKAGNSVHHVHERWVQAVEELAGHP